MNKLIDIILNKLKDILRWFRKTPTEDKTFEVEKALTVELPKAVPYEHGLNTTNWGPNLKPKEFPGFEDEQFNKDTPIRVIPVEEYDTFLEERKKAKEVLFETNEKGDILMGRDPETNEGYYMSKDTINHIRKVMYYKKQK